MIKSWEYKNEYNYLKKKILASVDKTLKSGKLFFGNELNKFEKNFLKINKSKYGVAVASGTDAIYLSLKALNIGQNDEVITVANTAIPTVSAIKNTGASEKFIDIKEDYLMNVNEIEKVITKKTKAIIPVHLYGQSCEMDKIIKIAKICTDHNILLVDCPVSGGQIGSISGKLTLMCGCSSEVLLKAKPILKKIASKSDLFVVLGAKNSSNSLRLVEVAKQYGAKESMLLEKLEKFDLNNLKHISNIGVTASASAPETFVQNFIKLIKKNYQTKIHEEEYKNENVFFKIPQHLKAIN